MFDLLEANDYSFSSQALLPFHEFQDNVFNLSNLSSYSLIHNQYVYVKQFFQRKISALTGDKRVCQAMRLDYATSDGLKWRHLPGLPFSGFSRNADEQEG